MDVRLTRYWKNIKNVLKRVSKIACFVGPNYGGLKAGWKTTTFYPPNGFGCHFQRITPIELKFNMKQHNTLNNFSCFMAQPLKMLKKVHFFGNELTLCFFVNIFLIQFVAKKGYFFSIFRGGAIKHEKFFRLLCCFMYNFSSIGVILWKWQPKPFGG